MKVPTKIPIRLTLLIPVTAWLGVQACVDNEAAYRGILGETRQPSDAPLEPGASGGAGATSGMTSNVSVGGTGGASTDGSAGEAGEGGASDSDGSGGVSVGGSGGSDGVSTTGFPEVPVDSPYYPPCYLTPSQSGEEIKKGTPCTPEDPELCYRPCGPSSVGWKTETCLAGVYAEGDCTFPDDRTYECYKIPAEIDAVACQLDGPPSATDECNAPLCTACNFAGQYQDTGDNVKDGYCVCLEPDADGIRRWTCASNTAWPCPFGRGC